MVVLELVLVAAVAVLRGCKFACLCDVTYAHRSHPHTPHPTPHTPHPTPHTPHPTPHTPNRDSFDDSEEDEGAEITGSGGRRAFNAYVKYSRSKRSKSRHGAKVDKIHRVRDDSMLDMVEEEFVPSSSRSRGGGGGTRRSRKKRIPAAAAAAAVGIDIPPRVRRRRANTTNSFFLESTMGTADLKATLHGVAAVLHLHIVKAARIISERCVVQVVEPC